MKKSNVKPTVAIYACAVAVAAIAAALCISSRNNSDVNCAEIITKFNESAKNNPLQELTEEVANCKQDK